MGSLAPIPPTLLEQMGDTLTLPEAERLARRIMHYWSRRGYDVNAWAEPTGETMQDRKGVAYIVRSDLGPNGMPQRRIVT